MLGRLNNNPFTLFRNVCRSHRSQLNLSNTLIFFVSNYLFSSMCKAHGHDAKPESLDTQTENFLASLAVVTFFVYIYINYDLIKNFFSKLKHYHLLLYCF